MPVTLATSRMIDVEGDTPPSESRLRAGQLGHRLCRAAAGRQRGRQGKTRGGRSVKAASDLCADHREVTEANGALEDDPALVNSSPEDEGWFFS